MLSERRVNAIKLSLKNNVYVEYDSNAISQVGWATYFVAHH